MNGDIFGVSVEFHLVRKDEKKRRGLWKHIILEIVIADGCVFGMLEG